VTTAERLPDSARILIRVGAGIVALEALVFVVLAVLDIANLSGDRRGFGIGVGVLLAIYGAFQMWAAWRFTHGDAWARSPMVVTQLIQLLLAWNLRGADPTWLAPVAGSLAIVALACLLAPPVTQALGRNAPM